MWIRGNLLIIILMLLGGCGATSVCVKPSKIVLPPEPPPVVMDNGEYDKSEYPDTYWVDPPKVDLNKQRAWWGFKDVEKISEALTKWPKWGSDVKEIVEGHNRLAEGKRQVKERPWWRIW